MSQSVSATIDQARYGHLSSSRIIVDHVATRKCCIEMVAGGGEWRAVGERRSLFHKQLVTGVFPREQYPSLCLTSTSSPTTSNVRRRLSSPSTVAPSRRQRQRRALLERLLNARDVLQALLPFDHHHTYPFIQRYLCCTLWATARRRPTKTKRLARTSSTGSSKMTARSSRKSARFCF